MSLRINLNSAALTAHRQLTGSDNAVGKSIERLSSGYKINNAGDDPAGLVISEKLRAQVGGLNQAVKNAGDAVNMVKTAEGALQEVNRLLGNMRTLAVHAANVGANDDASLKADQDQIASSIATINKIASETQFGGKKLLDGSAGISTTILGSKIVSADLSKSTITSSVKAVNVALTGAGTQVAAQATLSGNVDVSALNLSAAVVNINGVDITLGANGAATKAAINAQTELTNVVADVDGVTGFITLTQRGFGTANRIDVTGAGALTAFGAANAAAIGADAKAIVTDTGLAGGTIVGAAALWASGSGTVIKDTLGNSIQLTDAEAVLNTNKADQFDVTVGSMSFQVGAYAGQTRSMNISSVNTTQLGLASGGTAANLSLIDVSSDAQDALKVLDKAISDVSSLRATLGSAQKNTFESAVNSLKVASENIAASESTIRDTDMAAEMVEFTKNQILMQAGTAMLAQANQAPQALLRLLQ